MPIVVGMPLQNPLIELFENFPGPVAGLSANPERSNMPAADKRHRKQEVHSVCLMAELCMFVSRFASLPLFDPEYAMAHARVGFGDLRMVTAFGATACVAALVEPGFRVLRPVLKRLAEREAQMVAIDGMSGRLTP